MGRLRRRPLSVHQLRHRTPTPTAPGNPARGSASRYACLSREQDARLIRDLGEHRGADIALGPGAGDQIAELVDAGALLFDPLIDDDVGIPAPDARKEF